MLEKRTAKLILNSVLHKLISLGIEDSDEHERPPSLLSFASAVPDHYSLSKYNW